MTLPLSLNGNGGCGTSGPAIGSRGPSGRMVVDVVKEQPETDTRDQDLRSLLLLEGGCWVE